MDMALPTFAKKRAEAKAAAKANGASSNKGILEQLVIFLTNLLFVNTVEFREAAQAGIDQSELVKDQTPDAIQTEIHAFRCRLPKKQTKGKKNPKEDYAKFTFRPLGALERVAACSSAN